MEQEHAIKYKEAQKQTLIQTKQKPNKASTQKAY
jgi:hypothetical protein